MSWRKKLITKNLLKMGLVYVSGSDMMKGERKRFFVSLQSTFKI
jgi:hypothetical protein